MKQVLHNANFPQDSQGRTYHVATRSGQVANRIITVGDTVRARRIAQCFDGGKPLQEVHSQRNFLTLTGTYKGTPISVVSANMGFANADFFLRESRAVVEGELVVVRLGSCGSLNASHGLGTVVVPRSSIGISRNYDYFHPDTTDQQRSSGDIQPYTVTRPLDCDADVHDHLLAALQANQPKAKQDLFNGDDVKAVGDIFNASADTFYGSQGRTDPTFFDANEDLIEKVQKRYPQLSTLEMETFVLNSLAVSANAALDAGTSPHTGRIRTGAVQMIFANRTNSAFISPQECHKLELWAGKSVFEALHNIQIPADKLQSQGVWSGTQ